MPILSAGHYNLTSKNFTSAIISNKLILVGFSAYSCHRCITVEPEYEIITRALTLLGVPFARSDVNKMKSIALEIRQRQRVSGRGDSNDIGRQRVGSVPWGFVQESLKALPL